MNKDNYITETGIKGLYVIERPMYADNRGFFREVFRLNDLTEVLGFEFKPVQWSHSMSFPKVIRAIHTEGWNKLVYPVTGKIFIAIVDTRPESETFGKVETFTIDSFSRKALFISKGLGNSICVKGKEPVNYMYIVDEYWDNSKASGISWNDKDLNIKWPVKDPIISDRDYANPTMRESFPKKYD